MSLGQTAVPRWLAALVIGIAVVALALLPFMGWVMLPGMALSVPFFPEGIHTGSGAGVSFFITVALGSALFWAFIAFILLRYMPRRPPAI
jgi:hypothetical protein